MKLRLSLLFYFGIVLMLLTCRAEQLSKPSPPASPPVMDPDPGPTTASAFFANIDLQYPGLGIVKAAVEDGDYRLAEKAYVAFQRTRKLPRHPVGSELPPGFPSTQRLPSDSRAEITLDNTFRQEDFSYRFAGAVDWHFNPTDRQQNPAYTGSYKQEWTVLHNRMQELAFLAEAFGETANPLYVEKIDALVNSWIDAAPVSRPGTREDFWLSSWRSLEAGIRAGDSWPPAWRQAIRCPAMQDSTIIKWTRSFLEHGAYLEQHTGSLNWLTTESKGLYTIGLLFPEFKNADRWRALAIQRLQQQIATDFYPDGAHIELAPEYHRITAEEFAGVSRLAMMNDLNEAASFSREVEKMIDYLIRISMPNRLAPRLNDTGYEDHIGRMILNLGPELYRHRPDYQWLVSEGQQGFPPHFNSVVLPWAGQAVMRENWQPDANYLLFEYGPYGAGYHQHEDKLGVHIAGYGDLFVFEAGRENYGDTPLRQYCLSSQAHSVVTVDHLSQNREDQRPAFDRAGQPYPLSWADHELYTYASATYGDQSKERYGSQAHFLWWQRHIVYLRPEVWIILDVLHPKDSLKHSYQSYFHLNADAAWLDEETQRVRIEETGRPSFSITPLVDGQLTSALVSGQETPEYLGWELFESKADRPVPTLRYDKEGTGDQYFSYVFQARKTALSAPRPSITQVPTEETQIALRVESELGEFPAIILVFSLPGPVQTLKWAGESYPVNGILVFESTGKIFDLNTGFEF